MSSSINSVSAVTLSARLVRRCELGCREQISVNCTLGLQWAYSTLLAHSTLFGENVTLSDLHSSSIVFGMETNRQEKQNIASFSQLRIVVSCIHSFFRVA